MKSQISLGLKELIILIVTLIGLAIIFYLIFFSKGVVSFQISKLYNYTPPI